MCGIVGYTGRNKSPGMVVFDGLKRLEYRGYDSAGVAYGLANKIIVHKATGRVKELEMKYKSPDNSLSAIGHTRWATHGGVEHRNAHPHESASCAIVHNGVIDNADELRYDLERKGYNFVSDTDSEVIAHLIDYCYRGITAQDAVRDAVGLLNGTFGLAIIFKDSPEEIHFAKNGSPLVIGIGDGDYYLASDTSALVQHTDRFIYLEDGDIGVIRPGESVTNNTREVKKVEQTDAYADLGDYEHFMLKEIHEQPKAIARCFSTRISETHCKLKGFGFSGADLAKITSVTILGCGTSYHAGMLAKTLVEKWCDVPCYVELASEFALKSRSPDPTGIYLAISQSGETYDTLECIKELHKKGINVYGVVNTVGSSIARLCGAGVYIHAGPEIAVASTKAFTTQYAALQMFACMLGRSKRMSISEGRKLCAELNDLRSLLDSNMGNLEERARVAAKKTKEAKYILFLGRGPSYPIALEGALKMKEIAYIPCDAYAGGEMKHGPIAMIEDGTPVICIVPHDEHRTRMLANIEEVKARGAKVIAFEPKGYEYTAEYFSAIFLQFLAYYTALELGYDIDKPRNLAKSVTVS